VAGGEDGGVGMVRVHLPPLQRFLQGMLRHLQHGRRASGFSAQDWTGRYLLVNMN
jgi:hypothetical protein